uniref:kelch domain-containing protein 1 n=1 Tax=Oncorhynchus gorbuscha TaxID=8017 RepID=UPI001EAF1120
MDSAVEKHSVELVALERSGHTAVLEGNTLHVWGGYMSTAESEVFLPSDEIWLYDLERGVWETCQMSGEIPPPMSGTCSCFLIGHMYIFGGYDDTGQTNQLYRVNLLDGDYRWKNVKAESGSPPSPRDKLCCWVFNNRVT